MHGMSEMTINYHMGHVWNDNKLSYMEPRSDYKLSPEKDFIDDKPHG